MSYPINYPTPQNANVQIFNANTKNNTVPTTYGQTWVKPQGASFVWFTLIGAGGAGDGTNGGGSAAVTNFMCPAFLIPDNLNIIVPTGDVTATNRVDTLVYYTTKNTSYLLLQAVSGDGISNGASVSGNAFTAMGFYQSIAGQQGTVGAVSASSTTFLSGGGTGSNTQSSNYGYSSNPSSAVSGGGFFQMQPIIVGTSGMGFSPTASRGGIGCGSGVGGSGGDGLCVIITW